MGGSAGTSGCSVTTPTTSLNRLQVASRRSWFITTDSTLVAYANLLSSIVSPMFFFVGSITRDATFCRSSVVGSAVSFESDLRCGPSHARYVRGTRYSGRARTGPGGSARRSQLVWCCGPAFIVVGSHRGVRSGLVHGIISVARYSRAHQGSRYSNALYDLVDLHDRTTLPYSVQYVVYILY